FFQAEDGIRDFHVTGVQTCALPILVSTPLSSSFHRKVSAKGASSIGMQIISLFTTRWLIFNASFAIFLIVKRASSSVDDQLSILSGISCSWLFMSAKKA